MNNYGIKNADPVERFQAAELLSREFHLPVKVTTNKQALVAQVSRALHTHKVLCRREPETVRKIEGYLSGRVAPTPPLNTSITSSAMLGLVTGFIDLPNASATLQTLSSTFQLPVNGEAESEAFRGREKEQIAHEIGLFLQDSTKPLNLSQKIESRKAITNFDFLQPLFKKASTQQLQAIIAALLQHAPHLESLNFADCIALTPAIILSLQGFTKLRALALHSPEYNSRLTDAHLTAVGALKGLTSLNLHSCTRITGAGLQALQHLTELQELNLAGCDIGQAEFEHISKMKHMRSLDLSSNTFIEENFQSLSALTELESLKLLGSILGTALQHIAHLKKLKKLNFECCGIERENLAFLAQIQQLEELNVRNVIITHNGMTARLGDEDLQYIAPLTQLRTLNLEQTQVGNNGLQHLVRLTLMHTLKLSFTQVNDEGLPHLLPMTQLRELMLAFTAISDIGLECISGLTLLQKLGLTCARISNEGLRHLSRMKELRGLYLYRTQISDEGLARIAHCTKMQALVLSDTQVTGTGLIHLLGMTRLQQLQACNTKIGNNALEHLVKLQHLEILGLNNTQVGNQVLDALQQMERLIHLDVTGSQVTEDTAQRISLILQQRNA